MTRSRPVERVVAALVEGGYGEAPDAITISTLVFEFDAVLVDQRNSADLVLVVDLIENPDERSLRRRIEAVGRALDMAESRRSLSLALVGPDPSEITLSELSRVCRVFRVGTPTGPDADKSVRAALAVLLPLNVAEDEIASVRPLDLIKSEFSASSAIDLKFLVDASVRGEDAVRDALRTWLNVEIPGDHQ